MEITNGKTKIKLKGKTIFLNDKKEGEKYWEFIDNKWSKKVYNVIKKEFKTNSSRSLLEIAKDVCSYSRYEFHMTAKWEDSYV